VNNSKIKIALMSYAMDNRLGKGTALYARKIIERMVEDERFEVALIHFDESDDPIYKKAREIVMPKIKLPFATRFVRLMLFFWKYRKENFDIIQWFQPRMYPLFWFAPAKHIILTAHGGGDVACPGKFIFSKSVFNFVLTHFNKKLDAIIADSDFGKREIVQYYRARPDRVHSVYIGGGEDFVPIPRTISKEIVKEKYDIDTPYILDVSRLEPHKNVNSLIKAYILLRDTDKKRNEKLVIVGNPSSAFEETYDLAGRSDYAKDIKFVDHVSQVDLNAVYAAAEIFVFPSLNEGFGLPVVEAMASGTPVITSNVTSLPEIAGNAGITVNPLNIREISEKMGLLLSNDGFRSDLIKKGFVRSGQFTWKKCYEELADLIITVVSK
jgi:glycosyltransferase involved in cell wall biosynthesis